MADRVRRADRSLDALAASWRRDAWRSAGARELAIEFRRRLQGQPEFIGLWLRSKWIEQHYVTFCRSLALTWWPPFTEFAAELKQIMPRKRHEVRRRGKRVETVTSYLVLDLADLAVDIEEERRSHPCDRWAAQL
jgi:hypothetical protein